METPNNLPNIKWVSLMNNNLTTLSEELFDLEKYKETRYQALILDLKGNPLGCGSDLCWIKEGLEGGMDLVV